MQGVLAPSKSLRHNNALSLSLALTLKRLL